MALNVAIVVGRRAVGTQIEITNDGVHVPWSASVAVQQCIFRAPTHNRQRPGST